MPQRVLGEIDVAVLVDDALIILECKNSLLPCNLFELRTSYDHCKKASAQLDGLVVLLNDLPHMHAVLAKLNRPGAAVNRIITGIVVGNRLFAGLRIGDHLVVTLGQLARFVAQGDIVIAGQTARTRDVGPLTADHVAEFFAGSLYQRMLGAMESYDRDIACTGATLRFQTYALDLLALAKQFGVEVAADTALPNEGGAEQRPEM